MGDNRGQPDLESKLAEFVRAYLEAAPSSDSSQEQEALRWLCSGRILLGEQLQRRDGEGIKVISPIEVSVRGSAIGAKAACGPFWIKPFFGIAR